MVIPSLYSMGHKAKLLHALIPYPLLPILGEGEQPNVTPPTATPLPKLGEGPGVRATLAFLLTVKRFIDPGINLSGDRLDS